MNRATEATDFNQTTRDFLYTRPWVNDMRVPGKRSRPATRRGGKARYQTSRVHRSGAPG